MKDLIRKVLSEQKFPDVWETRKVYGCYLLQGEEKKFCTQAMKKIEKNKTSLKAQFKEILGLGLNDDEIKKKLLKYEKTNKFFYQSRHDLHDFALKITGSCSNAETAIKDEINDLNNKIVVLFRENQEETYHLINRLDTNTVGLAYLLTIFRRNHFDKKDDSSLINNTDYLNEVEKFYDLYFKASPRAAEKGGESIFFEQVFKYLGEDSTMDESLKNSMLEALYSIKKTRQSGLESEEEGFAYIKKTYPSNKVVSYAGDFNFVDMIGVDGAILSKKKNQWIPLQIKSNISSCGGNYRFCENMCIGKNDKGNWVELYYSGSTPVNLIKLTPNVSPLQDYVGYMGWDKESE
jgi:hypothetical protein